MTSHRSSSARDDSSRLRLRFCSVWTLIYSSSSSSSFINRDMDFSVSIKQQSRIYSPLRGRSMSACHAEQTSLTVTIKTDRVVIQAYFKPSVHTTYCRGFGGVWGVGGDLGGGVGGGQL